MNNNEETKIQGYKTFGFREEWLQEYLVDPEYFWKSNSLGTAQVDGFKAWLKDAEINDSKNKLTRSDMGADIDQPVIQFLYCQLVCQQYQDRSRIRP